MNNLETARELFKEAADLSDAEGDDNLWALMILREGGAKGSRERRGSGREGREGGQRVRSCAPRGDALEPVFKEVEERRGFSSLTLPEHTKAIASSGGRLARALAKQLVSLVRGGLHRERLSL